MTHHTDAERAEFDLMRFAFESKGSEAYKAWLIEVRDGDSYKPWGVVNDWRNWQTAWQAARRAPAAPVPQGVVEPIDTVKYWRDAYANPQGDEHFMGHGMVVKIFDDYLGMLAAAPQPPEAAPVQLPEPVAYQWLSTDNFRISGGPVSGAYWNKLYTEQQVRELLANHGIQEQST